MSQLVSQEIEKPILNYSYACANAGFNSFELKIAYNTSSFNNDNVFTLELSDKNGDFSLPIAVGTISDQNTSFAFTTTFQVPINTHGEGYKLRVKASSPEKISPESNAFEAYYITSERLILNDYTDVLLCYGASKELALNVDSASKYQWYKNGIKFHLGGSKLTVTDPGLYYSEIFYGSCFAAVVSNIVEVSKLPELEIKIEGDAIVEVCSGSSYVFEASINNRDYLYSWFKDGIKINGLPTYSPTYTSTNELGTYYVEIEDTNGCTQSSAEVLVKETDVNFSITPISNLNSFILEGEIKVLKIDQDATNASVKWFKGAEEIPDSNNNQITITVPGIYKAEVTGGSSCASSKESPAFIVSEITRLVAEVQINSAYISCQSNTASLEIKSINVFDADDKEHALEVSQYGYLNFKWFKNGMLINGLTETSISLSNFDQNGVYYLKATIGLKESVSNKISVQLSIPNITIASPSNLNIICEGDAIALTTAEHSNYAYQWSKDGILVPNANDFIFEATESGKYTVEVAAYGCKKMSEEVLLNDFDSSIITIDTPLEIILNSNEVITVTASGADSYEWLDDTGNLLSAISSIEISTAGNYNLLAKLNNCEVLKTVMVSEEEVKTVPNALTLNGDGINDTWTLSNSYAFKAGVEVQIYNSNGKLILKTTNYQNDWPRDESISKNQLFFYVIKQSDKLIKKGTISVIK